MTNPQQFGATLRKSRENAGLSLRALATKANIDPAYLSRMERGHNPPPRKEMIESLADQLCVAGSLEEAECARLHRDLLEAAGKLANEATLISDLRHRFADRLRDEGLEDWAVDLAVKEVDLQTMERVLVGEEPLEIADELSFCDGQIEDRKKSEQVLMLSSPRMEDRASDYVSRVGDLFGAAPQRSASQARKPKPQRIAAGERAHIEISGKLDARQRQQVELMARLLESILKEK